jgi:hypothetical protein
MAIETVEERALQRLKPTAKLHLQERSRLSREILGAAWTEKMVEELRPDQAEAM